MRKPAGRCTVISIAAVRDGGNQPPPQPAQIRRKVAPQVNQYSRNRFLNALLLTHSWERAKARSEVREPWASEYVCTALAEAMERAA